MEVRKQVLPKKLIWKEEEREQEEKQNREKAVQPLALGAMNGAAKGVAAARQWQMVNRGDKPKAAIPKAEGAGGSAGEGAEEGRAPAQSHERL